MKFLVESHARALFSFLAAALAGSLLAAELLAWQNGPTLCLPLLAVFGVLGLCVLGGCGAWFRWQERTLEQAVDILQACRNGDPDARIACSREGELYRLFHEVNSLAAMLNAHAEQQQREKQFLKNTIADISHQLKTPLAALNIYNGLLQEETGSTEETAQVREFAALSEQELDRMETLVQNLLKITRLDAGVLPFEKEDVEVSALMQAVQRQFACRAEQEQKQLTLQGETGIVLHCDRVWMEEALGNLVKNALDHTKAGDCIALKWDKFADFTRIRVQDTGSGIHPEDLPHRFKRFYRSRFAQNSPGIGLGLPLAKSILEAHGGTLEVEIKEDGMVYMVGEVGYGGHIQLGNELSEQLRIK